MSTWLGNYIRAQRIWSLETFGKGLRTKIILDHIKSEIKEVEAEPKKLEEWVDIIMLAVDGAWRAGHKPDDIVSGLVEKFLENQRRDWDENGYHILPETTSEGVKE